MSSVSHKESLCVCIYFIYYTSSDDWINSLRSRGHVDAIIIAPTLSCPGWIRVGRWLFASFAVYSIFLISDDASIAAGANAGSYFSSIDLYIQRTRLTNTLRCSPHHRQLHLFIVSLLLKVWITFCNQLITSCSYNTHWKYPNQLSQM